APTPDQVQKLFDELPELSHAFNRRRMTVLREERTQEEKALGLVQEHLRLHTQIVRNWGYFDRVIRITSDICRPIDDVHRKSIGVSGTDLILVFRSLVRERERKVNARYEKLTAAFRCDRPVEVIEKYLEATQQVDDLAAVLEFVKRENLTTDQVKS